MAAPMQHMAGAGQFMQQNRPGMGGGPQLELGNYVFQFIQNNSIGVGPGWQANVPIAERVRWVQELISNMLLANQNPGYTRQNIADWCLNFELEIFTKAPEKSVYDQRLTAKIREFLAKRQGQAPQIQQAINAQAQQQRLMMNQQQQQQQQQALLRAQMAGRGMAPGQQGFQHLQNPMQVSQLPQQAPQMGLSLSNSMNPQMNPNQPGFGMPGGPQRGADQMGQMSEMDKQRLNHFAQTLMNNTSDAQKQALENHLNNQMNPQMRQQLQQENKSVLMVYFQREAARRMQSMRQAHMPQRQQQQQQQQQQGMPQNAQGMPMQPGQQRPMNPGMMNNMGQPGGQMGPGPFSNMESIMNEHKQGLLAESQGQLVVPASSGPGRNSTPQPPMGGMHPQNMFGQGPGPQPRPQMQNGLDLQQQAILKQQMAASAQAQHQRASLQGQPGGLSGPMPVSQTPAMENLNAPVPRPPVALGQMGGPPNMQGNPSFGPGLDARFNQQGPQGPMNGLASDPMMRAMLAQLKPDQHAKLRGMPPDKLNDVFTRWKASPQGRMAAVMGGRPAQQPMNPANQPNPMGGMPTPQPNGGMPPQMARMLGPGGQPNQMRMRPGANMLQHPQAAAFMDNMDVPPQVLRGIPGAPPEIKKWGQLKAWAAQQQTHPISEQMKQKLRGLQINMFQQLMASRGLGGAGTGPGVGPGQQQPGAPRPSPMATAQSLALIEVTPQDIQNARTQYPDKFNGHSDGEVKAFLQQVKLRKLQANQMAGLAQPQQQPGQPSQPPVSQPGAPQGLPQPQPTPGPPTVPEPNQNAASSAAQGPKAARPAQQNKTMPLNPSPATAAKSLKRPSTDDLELSAQQSTPTAQRPPSQAGQGSMNGGLQNPPVSASQTANMSLEEKQKFLQGSQRYKVIHGEELRSFAPNKLPEVPVPPEQRATWTTQLVSTTTGYLKMSNILPRWFTEFRDENRLRMFFQARLRLLNHFEDASNLQGVKNSFTLSLQEILQCRQLLASIVKECQMFSRPGGPQTQQPPPNQPGPKQAPTPVTNEPNSQKPGPGVPKPVQRPGSRGFQPPAAPTSTHAPFQFGAASPDGRPQYVAPPAVTRENLQMPPTKKIKTGQQTSSPAVPGSQTASPQTKVTSPDLKKHEPKPVSKAPAFQCTVADCEAGAPTFPTDALRKKHMEDFHVAPFQNAEKFLEQSLYEAFDDVIEVNTDGPAEKRGETLAKQEENGPAAQPARAEDKASVTPKVGPGQAVVELQPPRMADNVGGTIDPQNLLTPLVPDMSIMMPGVNLRDLNHYRSITPPEDTPESSKDSGVSEPNSDIGDTSVLDIEMSFQPFDDNMFDSLTFGNENLQPELITDDMLVNYDDPSFNKMQPLGDMSKLWTFNC